MEPRIFVQIAAYRDPELLPTLRDCVAKAERPDRLRFGLAWQHGEEETLAEFAHDPRMRIFECHWRESRGACWARHQLQQLYDGEPLTLALDSHHRFLPGWDRKLKAELRALPAERPVLTSYLPPYVPGQPMPKRPGGLVLAADDRFTDDGVLLFNPIHIKRRWWWRRAVRARFLSAHFVFASGQMVEDCPHDPLLYFHGEEISLSVRAFTHGYDLFHPVRPQICHFYLRDGRPKHWNDHSARNGAAFGYDLLNQLSFARLRALFGMEPSVTPFGRFGFGSKRSLADYEAFAGIDFAGRVVSETARQGIEPTAKN